MKLSRLFAAAFVAILFFASHGGANAAPRGAAVQSSAIGLAAVVDLRP